MATYTTNLNLKKPAQSDKIRIADINGNMDDIDAAVGDIGERSIAAQIGDVEGALAIVSTGNVHGAITSGQYVYIKNHDTLDDGLYVATTNISANGTLSSSNVTADSAGGGLNALNGNISMLTTEKMDAWNEVTSLPTPLSGESYGNGSYYYKFGRFVFIAISVKFSSPPTNVKIFDLPSSIYPSLESRALPMTGGSSYLAQARAVITPQGAVYVTSEDNYVMGSAIYML